jgi:hypothetical protein
MRFALQFIVAVLMLIGAGCAGGHEEGSPPATQPSTTTTATPTPTPTPSAAASTPATLTRAQAGQRYLALIKPVNAVFEEPKCKESEDIFISGGTWPNDHPDRVVRECYQRYVPLDEKWLVALQTTAWPADSRADVADLISLEQAFLHCARKGARAATYEAMAEVYSGCFPEDDGSADRVRARFGLPGRSETP